MEPEFEDSERPTKRTCRTSVSTSPPPEHTHGLDSAVKMDGVTGTGRKLQNEPADEPTNISQTTETELSIPGLGNTFAQPPIVAPQQENSIPQSVDTKSEGPSGNVHEEQSQLTSDGVVEVRSEDLPNEKEDKSQENPESKTGRTGHQVISSKTEESSNFLLDAVGESLNLEAEVDAQNGMPVHAPEDAITGQQNLPLGETVQTDDVTGVEAGAEWEVDSSPYESSSDSSTSDDSSSEDSDAEEDDPDYAMLDPEEQARILMQGDGGSDDEGATKGGKSGGGHLRTANEKVEEIIPKPEIDLTPEMVITELGSVEATVENTVLVMGKVSGEYRVLETGSVLCLKDRTVVGVVAETLGRVQQPLYTIRFTNAAAIQEAGLAEKGTPVFYVEQHSSFVFTQPLKAVKGSDASNVNDEEVGDEEMEFSDDEAEAEHKRQLKNKRQSRREARNGHNGPHKTWNANERANHPSDNNVSMYDDTPEISYDDVETPGDDGYTPLARPANLPEMMNRREPPLEGWHSSSANRHGRGGIERGRGRGGSHQRGNRGRGRGDGHRGFGRDRRNDYSGHVNDQRGQQNAYGLPNHGSMAPPSWPQQAPGGPPQSFSYSPYGLPGSQTQTQMQTMPMPIPQPPSLSPQHPQQLQFSPSPISPLPSQQFQWPSPHPPLPPSPQQHLAVPPAGTYSNPALYQQGHPSYNPQMGYGPSPNNSAAFAQVQAQLEMLKRSSNPPR